MQNRLFGTMVLLTLLNCTVAPSIAAGPNDFFGGVLPGAMGSLKDDDEKPAQAETKEKPAPASVTQNPSDFTDDEKRMQRKYKFRVKHAKELIARGEEMMAKAPNHDAKEFKKGKILKEIGEKDLAELKSNNPFPEEAEKPEKDKKKKGETPESL